ncbi:MAG: mechanosensitive ion channel family protein [Spirochaetaceae bacterium]|jgi:MscS family membrane protein|nr:mechanosensitive ion channel family protein [Spirochaetaceae bacterium]
MDTIFLYNKLSVWLTALLFAGGGIVSGILLSAAFVRLLRNLKLPISNGSLHNKLPRLLKKTVCLFFVYAGFRLGLGKLIFSEIWELWEERALTSVFIVLICWSIAKLADELITQTAGQRSTPPSTAASPTGAPAAPPAAAPGLSAALFEIQPYIKKLTSFVMLLIPMVLVLKTLGFDISALLAGLGIGGAAIAFASKDLLAGFFGAVSVFIDKSFKQGDRIKVAGLDGYVVEIRLHASRIRTLENRVVTIPNSVFQNNPIENVSSEPHTKIVQTISIRTENGLDKARLAVELLQTLAIPPYAPAPESAAGSEGPPPVTALGAPSVAALSYIGIHVFKITFVYFVAKNADYWATINAVNMEILTRFEQAAVKM